MRHPRSQAVTLTLVAALLAACSAGKSAVTGAGGDGGSGADGGAGPNGGSGAGEGGGLLTVSTGGEGGGPVDGCADATKASIYVLGQNKQFARFEPQTSAFNVLGTLSCPGTSSLDSTFSMAVDRNGVAWVLFANGKIFHVNTETVACSATSFAPCQSNFCSFGMGFVSDAPGSAAETLYVSGVYNSPPGLGLARIDTASLALLPIADYDLLAGKGAELTGTGDARLFGYFQDTPIKLAEIDKGTAKILGITNLTEIPVGTSWAFAFWGGSFYVMSGTGIRKYEPATNTTTLIHGNVGFNIVGAGVSTCAPLEEPK